MSDQEDFSQEITSHLANPKNYGELKEANGVGVGVDNATNSYVMIYIKRDDEYINEINYTTTGSHDAAVLGSMFTEMIKGDTVANAVEQAAELEKDLQASYDSIEAPKIDTSKPEGEQVEQVSTDHQDCANMVLTAFKAAMRHIERKKEGIEEDKFSMNIAKRCPYSNTDCLFMMPENKQ